MKYTLSLSILLVATISVISISTARGLSLHEAAKAGDLDKVKQLIATGVDVDAKDTDQKTPLHTAIWSGHFEIAKYLVDKGADVNAPGKTGATPLMYACRAGTITMLMQPFSTTAKAETPPPLVSESDSSPYDGQLEFVQYLVEKGARVNLGNEDNSTPLHQASDFGYVEITRYLLAIGANVDAKTKSEGATALFGATVGGYVKTVESLLDKGADVNLGTYEDGVTPLMLAASRGHPQVVRLLLKKGAYIDPRTIKDSITPLMLAANHGHAPVVRLLLEKGADVNLKDKSGNDALKLSTDPDIIEMLKKAGAGM